VDGQRAVHLHPLRLLRLAHRPAQHGPDPGLQHAWLDRFDHVVVRPRLQARHHVHVVVAGGQHDDRQVAVGANAAAHLEAIHAGQHQVEHDDFRLHRAKTGQRLLTVVERVHAVTLPLQRQGQPVSYGLVVLDQQYARHGPHYRRSARSWLITRSTATATKYSVPATRTAPRPSDSRCHPATIVAAVTTAHTITPGSSIHRRCPARISNATANTIPAAAATCPLGTLL